MKYLIGLLFTISILFLGFVPQQSDFALIVAGFSIAFGSYFLLIHKTGFKTRDLLILAIILRVVMLFAFPNLSDDIYRFIWDGQLLHIGESPFTFLPSEYIQNTANINFLDLYSKLNSPDYYSVYPPFSQLIFYLSTFSFLNTSFVIKLFLLLAEVTTIYFGLKLLRLMKLPERNILWYALNPLIIIEIMVNIHFEGFMVCFFVLFLYFLKIKALNKAALFIALSISAKLIPLLFLPYFLFKWSFKKSMIIYLKVGLILLLIFSPMIFEIGGFTDSLDLYFRKFEFNGSVYFLLRALGSWWKGYNMIANIGPIMAGSVFIIIMTMAFRIRHFIHFSMLALFVFLLLSTTVHPWYASLGIILSVFSSRKYFILWSFLIILSYSHYALSSTMYYFFVGFEYLVLLGYFLYEEYQIPKVDKEHPSLESF